MQRRRAGGAQWVAVVALAGALGGQPDPAAADLVKSQPIWLVDTAPAGTPPVTSVVAEVLPPGAIVPPPNPQDPTKTLSPLTIVARGSQGFDLGNLVDSLWSGKDASGQPVQYLGLSFGPKGLQPGGSVEFNLSLDQAVSGKPNLILPPNASNLHFSFTDPHPPASAPTPPTAPSPVVLANTPEPLSIVVWASLASLGLLRLKRRRA